MKISINAPSYKRPQALDVLEYIPQTRIWICETELKKYRTHNKGIKIITCPKGIQGNVSRIRNYILDQEFKRGMDAVCLIDDDLKYIGYYEGNERFRLEKKDFLSWLYRNTFLCFESGAKLWGINLNQDKQCYREYSPFCFVSVVLGPFTVHLKNPIRYDENFPLKEDYDLSIQHLNKYRKILRLQKFFYICDQGGSTGIKKGGCSTYRNVPKELKQIKRLQKKWGTNIVKMDTGKSRSHSTEKMRKFDINPIIKVPIRGV